MNRILLALFCFMILGITSADAACYKWINDSPQNIVLNFVYLDASLNPNGQRIPYQLQHGASLNNCAGANTYYNVLLRNGKYNGWDAETIFGIGYHDDDEFTVTANASITGNKPNVNNDKIPPITVTTASLILDGKYLPTGNAYSIQITDLVCQNNTSLMTIYGGASYPFIACTNAAEFARIAIKNITTNSQIVQCGQAHSGDTCIVP